VYLFEPSRTPFDLSFKLFGIHVRVHPMFWVVTGILGSNQDDPKYVLMWIGVVFISVLIHELGHVADIKTSDKTVKIVLDDKDPTGEIGAKNNQLVYDNCFAPPKAAD